MEAVKIPKQKINRDLKLERHCSALAEVVVAIRPVYAKLEAEQKALIETMIGAAIWYIPKHSNAWTGCVSSLALKMFHPDSGVQNPKFSEEYVYPRKVAAKLLLEAQELTGARMALLFREKYGKLHYTTSDENKLVQPFQRAGVFISPEDAYLKAGIKFIEVLKEDLRLIKKRSRDVIGKYLAK